ncbi:hypothetical protein BaRGS_00021002, partial [Batillaria attramentaria]
VLVTVQGESFDCQSYNPNVCTVDAIPYCLVNGTVVRGKCVAQRAQCVDNVNVDATFAACPQTKTSFDCTNFNPIICTKDAIKFCLNNGTIVTGTCFAKRAVCLENKQVDDTYHACNHGSKTKDMGDNSSVQFSGNIFLLLVLSFVAILH